MEAAIADLATIVFFYLLRVGKSTMPVANRRTRIVQFGVKDMVFYHCGLIISNSVSVTALLEANGVTLGITNQKNRMRGKTTYQHTLLDRRISVALALVRHVATVMAAAGTENHTSLA